MPEANRSKEIFLKALEIASPAHRSAYLAQACGNDDALRKQIDAMLKAHAAADSFLEKPAADLADPDATRTAEDAADSTQPTRLGPYKLLQSIGEGGMGVVYMAEQEQPVRRRVALKIIKPGMDSKHVIARFRAEQQALAMMDHQNIAKVFDAGVTDNGRPFFVMELVHGVPLTKYCDDNKLTPRERLELFIPVCRAVQHAHQKGIIHRDLKPSNVLVCLYDGKPVAKVIDFGVAKAMEQPLTEQTMYTQFGQVIGTLEYMSPEQAEMSQLGVDTRSDIYSLGVMLYELLTGSTPLQRQRIKTAALDVILKLIREEEPPPPSSRLSKSTETLPTISQQRRMEPAQLAKLVRGELDWIVMRALEKDRTRRYDSASNLARDIERYLADEPVEACPPSTTYRLRKYAHKHSALLASVTAFALILIVGAGVSVWQAIRATNAEGVALKASEEADKAGKQAIKDRDIARDAQADLKKQSEQLRRVLYASDMKLVQVAWNDGLAQRALDLLARHTPKADETDLRGFEWFYWKRRLVSEARRTVLDGPQKFDSNLWRTETEAYAGPVLSQTGRRCADLYQEDVGRYRVRVWNTASGKLLASMPFEYRWPGDVQKINFVHLRFFPDDNRLLIELRGATEKQLPHHAVIDIEQQKVLCKFDGISLHVHKNGKWLMRTREGKEDKSPLTCYDANTGAEVKNILAPPSTEQRHFYSSLDDNLERLAYLIPVACPGAREGKEPRNCYKEIQIVASDSGKTLHTVPLPEPIGQTFGTLLHLSPDGKRLAVAPTRSDGQLLSAEVPDVTPLYYWDLETGKLLWKRTFGKAHNAPQVKLAPDGRWLVLSHTSGPPFRHPSLINTDTGEEITLDIPTDRPSSMIGAFLSSPTDVSPFSPDSTLVFLRADRGGLSVFATRTGERLFETQAALMHQVQFTRDGSQLIAVDQEMVVRVWDAAPWSRRAAVSLRQVAAQARHGFAEVRPDGKSIAFRRLSDDGREEMLNIYALATGKVIRSMGPFSGQVNLEERMGHSILCIPTKSGVEVRLLDDDRDAKPLYTWLGPADASGYMAGALPVTNRRLVFWPTCQHVGGAMKAERPVLIDLDTGKALPAWWDNWTDFDTIGASDDGTTIALIARRKDDPAATRRLFVIDVGARGVVLEQELKREGSLAYFGIAAVAPKGDKVVLQGMTRSEGFVQMRDLPSGTLRYHAEDSFGFHLFSPDGRRLGVIGGSMQSVRIWDHSGNELCRIPIDNKVCSSFVFSRDGNRLMAVRTGFERLPPEEWLEVLDATPLPGDQRRGGEDSQ